MTSGQTNEQKSAGQDSGSGSAQPFPFFDEYLVNVLKPRVEGLLGGNEEAMRRRVFAGVVNAISEQTGVPTDRVERLLIDELGLEIEVSLRARFAGSGGSGGSGTGGNDSGGDEDVIDVAVESGPARPDGGVSAEAKPKPRVTRVSPLARAVAGTKG